MTYHITAAKPDDMSWIARLEAEVYSAEDAVPERILRDWYNNNPDGFFVVWKGDERIGHVDILPLRPPALGQLLDGIILERDIKGADLYTPPEKGAIEDLYVESVALRPHPDFSRAPVVSFLLASFISLVKGLAGPASVRNVYAIAASGAGERLMKHLGFVRMNDASERQDKHEVWGAALPDIFNSMSAYAEVRSRKSPA